MDDNASFPPTPRPRKPRARRAAIPQEDEMAAFDAAQFTAPEEGLAQDGPIPSRAIPSRPRAAAVSRAANPTRRYSPWKSLQSFFSLALVMATLFTMWTPDNLFSGNMMENMFQAMDPKAQPVIELPTNTPSPRPRIGLVAGHWGNDNGSVCDDGTTELSVNLDIATKVAEILQGEGYEVDMLKEFDDKLKGYQALALVSIHNDSCDYINDQATGYKVASVASSIYPEKAVRLTACMSQRYKAITGMQFHYNTVTADMTEYHAFNEINTDTTAAIIETGFLNLDREILTRQSDLVARGVAAGILCFVRNEDIPNSVPTEAP